jgi:hypothetical protein
VPSPPAATLLITVRARRDQDFPDNIFVTLRCHHLGADVDSEEVVSTSTIGEAVTAINGWLEEL